MSLGLCFFFFKTLKSLVGPAYPPEQTSQWWAWQEKDKKENLDNEKQWERRKQQDEKKLTAFPRMHLS